MHLIINIIQKSVLIASMLSGHITTTEPLMDYLERFPRALPNVEHATDIIAVFRITADFSGDGVDDYLFSWSPGLYDLELDLFYWRAYISTNGGYTIPSSCLCFDPGRAFTKTDKPSGQVQLYIDSMGRIVRSIQCFTWTKAGFSCETLKSFYVKDEGEREILDEYFSGKELAVEEIPPEKLPFIPKIKTQSEAFEEMESKRNASSNAVKEQNEQAPIVSIPEEPKESENETKATESKSAAQEESSDIQISEKAEDVLPITQEPENENIEQEEGTRYLLFFGMFTLGVLLIMGIFWLYRRIFGAAEAASEQRKSDSR